MKITEKCKVIVASSLVAALMTGTALPALAASPAGDAPFAVLAQQNSAVTPEQVEALISQIGTVTRSRRAADARQSWPLWMPITSWMMQEKLLSPILVCWQKHSRFLVFRMHLQSAMSTTMQ